MYAQDSQLHGLWEVALLTRAMAAGFDRSGAMGGAATGVLVASLMSGAQGARVVMVEITGWDTHAGQRAQLSAQLTGLDAMIASLRDTLGPAWAETLVVVATEFGGTAAVNSTGGTDHGTASRLRCWPAARCWAGGSSATGRG